MSDYPLEKNRGGGEGSDEASVDTSEEPPNAVEVEKRLLGAVIQSSGEGAAHDMVDVIEGEYRKFYAGRHQRIAYAVMGLLSEGEPVDMMTVTEALRKMGELKNAGGAYYITELTTQAGVSSSVKKYTRIVVEEWLKRRIIESGLEVVQKAQDETTDAFEVLETSQEEILSLGVGDEVDGGRIETGVPERIEQHVESTRLRRSGESPLTGIPTPFDKINDMTGGWGDEELIILAARPSMGKSAFALADAVESAKSGYKTAIFSLEMGQGEWLDRATGYLGEVNMQKVARGYGTDQELLNMYKAAKEIEKLPLWVIDDPGITISGIRAKARRLIRTEGVEQIYIDYLQLVGSSGSFGTREQEVAYISRQLKVMAMDLEVPVIALSQLNRKSLSRGGGKRPGLSDLRESGALEQDADVVGFIHRPERLGIEQHDKLGVPSDGLADFIVSKQRNGPVGTVFMRFIDEYAKFESMDVKGEFGDNAEIEEDDEHEGSAPKASIPSWAEEFVDEDVQGEQATHEVAGNPDPQKSLMDEGDGPSGDTEPSGDAAPSGDTAPSGDSAPSAPIPSTPVGSGSALDGVEESSEEDDSEEDDSGEDEDTLDIPEEDGGTGMEEDDMPF